MREWFFLLLGLLLNEAGELSPHLMKSIVRWACRDFPETYRETLEETWLSELDACPGKFAKLFYIFSLVRNRQEVLKAIREAEGYLPSETSDARLIARAFDLLLIGLTLPILLPLLLFFGLLIWLDSPGPIIYKGPRYGYQGVPLHLLLFRTMYTDAEERLCLALELDPNLRLEYETHHKLRHDPRVTRVGAFLGKTGFYNLPQLLNVLAGDLSLIGPRPLPRRLVQARREVIHLYDRARPGMISPSLILNGFNSMNADEWLEAERHYHSTWSFLNHIKVLIKIVQLALFKAQ